MPSKNVKFVLGTHTVGDSTRDPTASFDDAKDVQALLDAFHERGYDQIDSARDYSPQAQGTSEKRLGQSGAATKFTVHTKIHSGHPGDHEADKIALSIQESLAALQTSSVETMYLHVPDRQTPFEDTARAMNEAFIQGKFKKFGLSNYTAAEVEQFIAICEKNGYVKPNVYQGHYNLVVRGGEQELFPLLRKHNMAFWAYSPAAGGFFSGKIDTSQRWNSETFMGNVYGNLYRDPSVRAEIATVQEAAAKQGITGHAAAIRWTAFHSKLDGDFDDAVVFGVSKLEQLHKTLDALEAGKLPPEVADGISAIYAKFQGKEPAYHL